jgi:hypothetical protein
MELINALIRNMVRGTYDLQKLRMQTGNRVTAIFKVKVGLETNGMTEEQLDKESKKLLAKLRKSYQRITDGIVEENFSEETGIVVSKLPSMKKFKGDDLITEYGELILVDNYMKILENEESQFKQLGNALKGIPIYDKFLANIEGIGPQMAGVIISEIDIAASEYPSSLWKYAGLDAVEIGHYTDELGKEHVVPGWEVAQFKSNPENLGKVMLAHDRYPVAFSSVGRSRKEWCLEKVEYKSKDGEMAVRNSITFNPFLKTKLVGVLGGSFLRTGVTKVDGVKLGAGKRLEMATTLGFEYDSDSNNKVDYEVTSFLKSRGYTVETEYSKYGQIYYDYKRRLNNSPSHDEKTDLHKHNMAIRYMIKRFLVDLYAVWRALEGLPVADEYSVAKLGMVHGIASVDKGKKVA